MYEKDKIKSFMIRDFFELPCINESLNPLATNAEDLSNFSESLNVCKTITGISRKAPHNHIGSAKVMILFWSWPPPANAD